MIPLLMNRAGNPPGIVISRAVGHNAGTANPGIANPVRSIKELRTHGCS
ncbi:MAG: hypothetical protein SV201_10800 [Pseudomonadota bacterium]|nr:hypothetical protein [Pseudomonadota bacterium]